MAFNSERARSPGLFDSGSGLRFHGDSWYYLSSDDAIWNAVGELLADRSKSCSPEVSPYDGERAILELLSVKRLGVALPSRLFVILDFPACLLVHS